MAGSQKALLLLWAFQMIALAELKVFNATGNLYINIHIYIYITKTPRRRYIKLYLVIVLGCGDYPNHMVNRSNNDTIVLGEVKLPWSNDTYRSCRALCKKEYPSFQFYQKFIKYESCECMKMKNGNDNCPF